MSELRAPDPTLSAVAASRTTPLVYTTNLGADLPVFHHQTSDEGPDCGTVNSRTLTSPIHIKHARWLGVPCRECFPEAPEPGNEWTCPDCAVEDCPGQYRGSFLRWQVR